MSDIKNNTSASQHRYQMELRQLTGLMMALGLAAVFQPLAGTVSHISPNGETVTEGIPFSGFIGGVCVISIGFLSVFMGFAKLVFNWQSKALTFFSLFWVQTSWIPYITGMTGVGRTARSGMGFIPAEYNPTPSDVRFVGACGILAILAYGFCFIGSISFTQFAFYSHLNGKSADRSGTYYRQRTRLYSYLLFQAGLAHFLLGAYTQIRFGGMGALENGPISVAMLFVSFPIIGTIIGSVQMVLGVWGVARTFGHLSFEKYDFAAALFAGWVFQVILHVLVQVGYVPAGGAVGAAPTIVGFSVGLNLMPAYLDYKSRDLPAVIPADYYGDSETDGDSSDGNSTTPSMDKGSAAKSSEFDV